MNRALRSYAFGRAFRLDLTDRHSEALFMVCHGLDMSARHILHSPISGLQRRGLVEFNNDYSLGVLYRPTKAGLLVYDLLVEAGEFEQLDRKWPKKKDRLRALGHWRIIYGEPKKEPPSTPPRYTKENPSGKGLWDDPISVEDAHLRRGQVPVEQG